MAKAYPNKEFQTIYNSIVAANQANTTPYPTSMTQEEFQALYDQIRGGMGDEATLKANIEAALRPMYDQSIAQLDQQRRANNAAIDVDAASRGMGNSTWVTDAKLQQLRGMESNIAGLNADYNAQLYNRLQNALNDRDNLAYNQAMTFMNAVNTDRQNAWAAQQQARQEAYSQAMQWWQIQQASKGSGGKKKNTGVTITPNTMSYNDFMKSMYGVDNVKNSIAAATKTQTKKQTNANDVANAAYNILSKVNAASSNASAKGGGGGGKNNRVNVVQ